MASMIKALLILATIQTTTASRVFSQCLSSNTMVTIDCDGDSDGSDESDGRIVIYQAYYELLSDDCDGSQEPTQECKLWLLSTTRHFIDQCDMSEMCEVGVQYPSGTFDCAQGVETTAAIIYVQYDCLEIDVIPDMEEAIDPLEAMEQSHTGPRTHLETPYFPQYTALDAVQECEIVLIRGTAVRFDILELKYQNAQPYCMYLVLQQNPQTICAMTTRQVFSVITLEPRSGESISVSFQPRDGASSVRFWIIITAIDESTNVETGAGVMTLSCGANMEGVTLSQMPLEFTTRTEIAAPATNPPDESDDITDTTFVQTTTQNSNPIVMESTVPDSMVTYVVPLLLIVVFIILLVVAILCAKRYAAKKRRSSSSSIRSSNRTRKENTYAASKRAPGNTTTPVALTVMDPNTDHAITNSGTGSQSYYYPITEVPEINTDVSSPSPGHYEGVANGHLSNGNLADQSTAVIEPEAEYEVPKTSAVPDNAAASTSSTGVQVQTGMGGTHPPSSLYEEAADVIKPPIKPRVNIITSRNEYFSYDDNAPTLSKKDNSRSDRPSVSDELEIIENDLYETTAVK